MLAILSVVHARFLGNAREEKRPQYVGVNLELRCLSGDKFAFAFHFSSTCIPALLCSLSFCVQL